MGYQATGVFRQRSRVYWRRKPIAPVLQYAPDIATGVQFDGTQRLTLDSALGGAAKSEGTLSFWAKYDTSAAGPELIIRYYKTGGEGTRIRASLNDIGLGQGDIVIDNDIGSVYYSFHLPKIDDGVWHHIICSWQRPNAWAAFDGVDVSGVSGTDTAFDYDSTEMSIGSFVEAGPNIYNGCLGEVYFSDSFFTNSAVSIQKFRTLSGKAVSLGLSGELPSGVAPMLYLSGGQKQFGRNFSGNANFTQVGSFTDCALPTSVIVIPGQALEADSATVVVRSKLLAAIQALEADSSTAVTRRKLMSALQALEADSAFTVTTNVAQAVFQALETDSSTVIVRSKLLSVIQALETGSSIAIARSKLMAALQAAEVDSATAVSRSKVMTVTQSVETDSALVVTFSAATLVVQAIEADSAFVVDRTKLLAVTQAMESDSSFSIARLKSLLTAQASETDSATAVLRSKVVAALQALEADTATAVVPAGAVTIGQSTETDDSFAITMAKVLGVGQSASVETSFTIIVSKEYLTGQAVELDTARLIARLKAMPVGQSLETDQALALLQQALLNEMVMVLIV